MSPEEQEISLVMQRDNLSALELRHRGEHRLKHPPNGMPQPRYEVVQHKFREVSRRTSMTLRFEDFNDWLQRTRLYMGSRICVSIVGWMSV